jgi:hypothetical protein
MLVLLVAAMTAHAGWRTCTMGPHAAWVCTDETDPTFHRPPDPVRPPPPEPTIVPPPPREVVIVVRIPVMEPFAVPSGRSQLDVRVIPPFSGAVVPMLGQQGPR